MLGRVTHRLRRGEHDFFCALPSRGREAAAMQVEPNWVRMYELARNMARKMSAEDESAQELTQAAVTHLLEVWAIYKELPDSEFIRVAMEILRNEMIRVIKDDASKGTHVTPKTVANENLIANSKVKSSENDVLELLQASDATEETETKVDFSAVSRVMESALTASELRVMTALVSDGNFTLREIAANLGDLSEGAVKIHKHNAIKKLKVRFNKDINLLGRRTLV